VARRAYSILKELRIASEIRTYHRTAFDHAARTQLLVEGSAHAIDVLTQAGVLGDAGLPLDRPPGKVVARPCCRSAYLRGAFLGAGSLSGPASPHLEIRTPLHGGAAFVRSVASATGARLRVADRGSHSIAYAKSWEAIEAYLAAAGASDTVLALEERALVAELRAEANRLANADHANLVRQSRSARTQLDAVHRLEREGVLDGLAPPLQAAAALRRRHPSLSSREPAGDEGRDGRSARSSGRARGADRGGAPTHGLKRGPRRTHTPHGGLALPGGGTRPRPPLGAGARS